VEYAVAPNASITAISRAYLGKLPALLDISGKLIDPERCVAGSVFVARPYQHIDILSACRRLHYK
jgi:hypothetical protein